MLFRFLPNKIRFDFRSFIYMCTFTPKMPIKYSFIYLFSDYLSLRFIWQLKRIRSSKINIFIILFHLLRLINFYINDFYWHSPVYIITVYRLSKFLILLIYRFIWRNLMSRFCLYFLISFDPTIKFVVVRHLLKLFRTIIVLTLILILKHTYFT